MKGSIFKHILHTVADALTTVAHEVVDEGKHVPREVWATLIERAIKAVAPNMADHPAVGPYAGMLAEIIAGGQPEDDDVPVSLGAVEKMDELPAVLRAHGIGEEAIAAIMHGQGAPEVTPAAAVQAKLAELAQLAPEAVQLPAAVEAGPGHVAPQVGYDHFGRRLDAPEAPQPVVHEAPHPWAGVTPQPGHDAYGRRLDAVAHEAARAAGAAPAVAEAAQGAPGAPSRPDPRRPPVR